MEIIPDNKKTTGMQKIGAQHLYLGITLVVVGVIWMLYNFDLVSYKVFDAFFSWQMLLSVVGGYLLAMKKWAVGTIVLAAGLFFVVTGVLDIHIPVRKIVLPAGCILAGLAVIFQKKRL